MNKYTAAILDALQSTSDPNNFSSAGTVPELPTAPGLCVHGYGRVALPLVQAAVPGLTSLCERAPFGKGEHTVLDDNVRRSWQIDADLFEFKNPDWDAGLQMCVQRVKQELGCDKVRL